MLHQSILVVRALKHLICLLGRIAVENWLPLKKECVQLVLAVVPEQEVLQASFALAQVLK